MAKLYAQIQSDKRGRVASKGGTEWIQAQITDNGQTIVHVEWNGEELALTWYDDEMPVRVNGEIRLQ